MIEIRLAAASDLDWLCAMEAECFSLPWTREQLERQLSGDGRLLYVAELNSNLAGYMGLDYVLDEGYVTNVCTAPEFRRLGVAGALIDAVVARSRELGLTFVSLEARVSNAAARSLYAQKGFIDAGIRPGYYEKPREDAVIMTLYLSKEGISDDNISS